MINSGTIITATISDQNDDHEFFAQVDGQTLHVHSKKEDWLSLMHI